MSSSIRNIIENCQIDRKLSYKYFVERDGAERQCLCAYCMFHCCIDQERPDITGKDFKECGVVLLLPLCFITARCTCLRVNAVPDWNLKPQLPLWQTRYLATALWPYRWIRVERFQSWNSLHCNFRLRSLSWLHKLWPVEGHLHYRGGPLTLQRR